MIDSFASFFQDDPKKIVQIKRNQRLVCVINQFMF